MKKRRHHYVWQYYLKAWCVDGLITCLRQGHRFKTGTPNVAIKTDFYRLCEFSEQYLDAVKQLCMRNSSQELQAIQQGWVDIFRRPFRLRKQAEEARGKDPAVDKLFDEILNNLEEDLHAHLEAGSIPHLDALRNGDLSFLDSDADAAFFFHFIAVQYLRTDKIRTATIATLKDVPLFDAERTWGLMSHLLATSVGHSLFMSRDRLMISLVHSKGGSDFITSDQPLINLRAIDLNAGEAPQEFEIYYPVSPGTALLVEADHPEGGRSERTLEAKTVEDYNRAVFRAAHEQVFAADEETLIVLQKSDGAAQQVAAPDGGHV